MKKGMFEISLDSAYEYRWKLKAKNGKVIAVSEGYTSISGCRNGIKSVMNHCERGCIVKEPNNRPTYII